MVSGDWIRDLHYWAYLRHGSTVSRQDNKITIWTFVITELILFHMGFLITNGNDVLTNGIVQSARTDRQLVYGVIMHSFVLAKRVSWV